MQRSSEGRPPGRGPGDIGGPEPGVLTVAATPIGQFDDATRRLAAALATAPIIAAEDTRRLLRLAGALGVSPTGRIVSYWEKVEASRGPELLTKLRGGTDVLLVSDAGMPGISDPGYRLVTAAVDAGIRVTALPGPSAVTTALAVSGLPTDRFAFEGFPPRKLGERSRRFAELAGERRTLVFFESGKRLKVILPELARAFGPDRRGVVCRELTKTYEEVRRGTLAQLTEAFSEGALGEVTLVVAGAPAQPASSPQDAAEQVALREQAGTPRREAIADVAKELRLPKREVYAAVVAWRSASTGRNRPGGDAH